MDRIIYALYKLYYYCTLSIYTVYYYLSHVVSNVKVHTDTDNQLYKMLRETNILMNDGQVKGPAHDEKGIMKFAQFIAGNYANTMQRSVM